MRLRRIPGRTAHLTGLVVLAAAAAVTAPASAQFGQLAGFSESMQREYLNRDLVYFADSLQLDKAQRDILDTLFEDYKNDFQAGLDAMQEELRAMKEELRAGDKDRILSMIFVPFEEWAVERRRLGDEFIENVKRILSEDQRALVPAFERRLVREKTLSKGVFSGESVNLLLLISQMRLEPPEAAVIDPIMDEYELQLHQELVRRNKVLFESQGKTIDALQTQDAAKNLKLIDDQIDARVRVRQVNDTAIERIREALPADMAADFYQKAMTRAYSKAYRVTQAERMFAAAVKLEDIDEETRQAIADLEMIYLQELERFREKLVEMIRDYEPKRERNRVEMFAARMQGEPPQRLTDPTLAEIRKREELDDQYILLLQSLLTEQQFLSLPGAERWLKRRTAKDPQRVESRNRGKVQRQKEAGKPGLGTGPAGKGNRGGLGSTGGAGGGTGGRDRDR